MRPPSLAALSSIALLSLLVIMSNAGAQSREAVTVSIRDFYFEPSQIVIEPGTTVQWVNEGSTEHTVFATNPAGAFLSGTLQPGESFTYTFPQRFPGRSPDSPTKPGTYEYFCKIHPDMKGSVTFGERGEHATTQEREGTTVQQPAAVPSTGGLNPFLLMGLLVVITMGALGWLVKRGSS
jgi:plastocyanin